MKKVLITLGNVLIVIAMMLFVITYDGRQRSQNRADRIEAFESMTVAMERVAAIYLTGEQRVCNSWAKYINANPMSGSDALDYLRDAITTDFVMGHILYTDGGALRGISTHAREKARKDSAPNAVEYGGIFEDGMEAYFCDGNTVNVTKSFTNPINGKQSIAFCQFISLFEGGRERPAILMRVIPISTFTQKWVFPTGDYPDAAIALLDANGDYIIHDGAFKNSNFYEFYQSYNEITPSTRAGLQQQIAGSPGHFEMLNSKGERCAAAYVQVGSTDSWAIISLIPLANLGQKSMDWALIGIVSAGLFLLLILDLIMMMRFNRRIKVAAEAADHASRAKTEFLSTMSHDIRTPMNAIIGLTTIAAKNPEDTATVKDSLHKINLASSHLLTLINDILDISKVESGKLNLSPVTFSIVECAENLVNISQPMVKEKNIDFNFRINSFEREYLHADQLRLNQIFINLLSNAIKYTQPGGRVSVDLKEEPGSTDSSVKLTYVVADTGIGMTPEFMERMYQPFSRQTDSRVNTIQGTGLGLAITKQMIDLMQGEIECVSEVGKGTTFTVTLEIPVSDRLPESMKLPDIRVLIADDDEVLLETAKDTLKSIGAVADTAHNGMEAVQMAESAMENGAEYQVVILDLKMPDMDGIEAARQIRARVGEALPILIVSAYDWSEFEEAARDAGVTSFISKPLFRSTLYDKLSELLGRESERRDQQEDNSDIAGMSILVAEDNDINWEIISMLLEMQGIKSERAENGQLAVERMAAARQGEFNLIFMDIQMPVMNGLDATRAIRALPDKWAANIPIIAMTADAFSENVAECMAAGMNGHIAKPIDMKLVIREIRRIKESEK